MKTRHKNGSGPCRASHQPRLVTTTLATAALAGGLLWGMSAARAQGAPVPAGSAEPPRGTVPAAPPPPVTSSEADLPSVIVVPHGHPQDAGLAKGCWARFYREDSYGGRSLTLVGPVQMPKIHIPGGLWVKWRSVVVGPRATVTTYDFEQYKNATAVLRPGQRIANLRDRKLGLFENIHSLRIACKR